MWFTDDDSPFASLLDGASRRAGMDPGAMSTADRGGLRKDAIGAFFANMRDLGAGRQSSLTDKMAALADSRMQRQLRELQMMKAQQMMGVQGKVADIFRRGAAGAQPTIPMETASPGFEPGAGESPESMPNPRDPKTLWADMYKQAGDYYASVGLTEEAKRYWDRSMQLSPTPKFSTDPKVVQTPQGPRLAVFDEQGNHKFIEGALPQRKVGREITVQGPNGPIIKLVDEQGEEIRQEEGYVKPELVNAGDRHIAVTPRPGMAEVPINLSPGQAEQLQLQEQGLGIQREQLGISRGHLGIAQKNAAAGLSGNSIAAQRLQFDRERFEHEKANKASGKALPSPAVTNLSEQASLADSTGRLLGGFNDTFAGKKVGGDVDNLVKRTFGDKTGQAQWWQDYALHEASVRNKLFGASLTPNEQGQWAKLAVSPNMAPDQVRKNLQRRAQIEQDGLNRMMNSYAKAGYNTEQIEALTGRSLKPVQQQATNNGREASGPVTDLRSAAQRELERRRNGGR